MKNIKQKSGVITPRMNNITITEYVDKFRIKILSQKTNNKTKQRKKISGYSATFCSKNIQVRNR